MTPDEAAQEVLRREAAQPGSVRPDLLSRAQAYLSKGADGPGRLTLPEQTIEGDKPGRFEELANRIGEPIAAAGQAFGNSMLAGIPNRVQPQTPLQQSVAEAHPIATQVGDFAGMMASPITRAASGVMGAAGRAAPWLTDSLLGRTVAAGAGAGLGGGAYSGTRTAAEGGDLGDVAESTAIGGGVGTLAGSAGNLLLGEPLRAAQGAIRNRFPEIGKVEKGGGRTTVVRGAQPGPELKAVQQAARAEGPTGIDPVDFLASRSVQPMMKAGSEELGGRAANIAKDVERYTASPEGQALVPTDKILQAYGDIHASNVAQSGKPVIEANLSPLKREIANLAEVHVAEDAAPELLRRPGAQVMSREEAAQRGFQLPRKVEFLSPDDVQPEGISRADQLAGLSMPEDIRTATTMPPPPPNPAGEHGTEGIQHLGLPPRNPGGLQYERASQTATTRPPPPPSPAGEYSTEGIQHLAQPAGAPRLPSNVGAAASGDNVLVVPREYNAKDLLQSISNLEDYIKANPKDRQAKTLLASLMEQRQAFEGLPELRGKHSEQLGGITRELSLAGAPERVDEFTKPQAEQQLFNQVKGYGDKGRYEPQNEALRSLAGRAGQGRQLELIDALKALQALHGQAPSAAVGSAGRVGIRLPTRSLAVRTDPLLEALQGAGIAPVVGAEAGRRKRDPLAELLGF